MKPLVLMLLLMAVGLARAGVDAYDFDDPNARARFESLSQELRCLVCQNQNIADSNAELATDLRRELHRMINEGLTDQQIVAFMTARYGDFVLYRPPVNPLTWLLWFGPILLLGIGLVVAIAMVRRRPGEPVRQLSPEERARLTQLLEEEQEERT
ncbi:MAG: cytochrome c-type biogenesis protein [Candidatus Competibacteraceae bacterium]|nr:cytochrome c-type biogenesis protein [Candidatus Competibacteraceae bacterium]